MVVEMQNACRTTHLLALMKKGDDAFNARDFTAMKAVHHPQMVAHITGSPWPTRGQSAHAEAIKAMIAVFADVHVDNDPARSSSEAVVIADITRSDATEAVRFEQHRRECPDCERFFCSNAPRQAESAHLWLTMREFVWVRADPSFL